MQYKIQAKPTEYKGIRFRSKLEAQWAVYFDYHLRLKWEYEPRVVKLSWCRYMPDFWFPELGVWAEVKPTMFDLEAFTKADELKEQCLLLDGRPDARKFYFITPSSSFSCPKVWDDGEPMSDEDYEAVVVEHDHGSYDYYKSERNYYRVDLRASRQSGRLYFCFGEFEPQVDWPRLEQCQRMWRLL